MNPYLNQYLSFPNFLSPSECAQVIADPNPFFEAKVYASSDKKKGGEVQSEHRKTQVKGIAAASHLGWVNEKLKATVKEINARYFHFQLSICARPEVMRYDSECFFKRHSDIGPGYISTRKLSMVVLLSAPEDYEGGELAFFPHFAPVPKTQGQLIVFPSYILHEVKPITSGLRYSLVNWVHGQPFS